MLASWVQLMPTNPRCRVDPPVAPTKSARRPAEACEVGFSARAIVDAGSMCPVVSVKRSGGADFVKEMEKRSTAPAFAAISTCHATLTGHDIRSITIGNGKAIPMPEVSSRGMDPAKLVVLGDTGCRANCDRSTWAFGSVAQRASQELAKESGVVIHVGDFQYKSPDDWPAWRNYFFEPAQSLLAAAPWIMVRGNRELLQRAWSLGVQPILH